MSNEPHLPPNCGHGDPSLATEGGWHMVLRKDKVEIGNSGSKPDKESNSVHPLMLQPQPSPSRPPERHPLFSFSLGFALGGVHSSITSLPRKTTTSDSSPQSLWFPHLDLLAPVERLAPPRIGSAKFALPGDPTGGKHSSRRQPLRGDTHERKQTPRLR